MITSVTVEGQTEYGKEIQLVANGENLSSVELQYALFYTDVDSPGSIFGDWQSSNVFNLTIDAGTMFYGAARIGTDDSTIKYTDTYFMITPSKPDL